MSFKTGLIKMAIKCTPNFMVIWVANIVLKGIAELKDFSFDLEPRTAYVQIQLVGEVETIDVWVEDFAIINNDGAYQLIIQKAESNRIWLSNILARITGKAWSIPEIPQLAPHLELISELFKAESQEQATPEQEVPKLEAPKQEDTEHEEN
ncbi:MAG: hypothetical protein Q8L79_01790 [Methylobacter sp.]|uniref:hypothetical protein n=1 Tax=Methylobacter sp. TaxID=2051955 RepID=UPI002730DB02|nr:hypothetical protein [Methylobacter sp.]MDP1663829.1 hypothetical protein [Methylobacter sp.]